MMTGLRRAISFVAAGVLAFVWGCVAHAEEAAALKRYHYSRPQMGSVFSITVYAADEARAEAAVEAAYKRVEEINAAASDYLPESELSRLNRALPGQAVKVSGDLFTLLARSAETSRRTEGAFDVTSAYAVQQWRRAKRRKQLPDEADTRRAVAMADWHKLQLDSGNGTVTKLAENVLIDLGGIGKGYAADAALKVLRDRGLNRAVVAASGDLAFGDPPPGKAGWDVALRTFESAEDADRYEHVTLSNCGCSTSGDLHQFLELGGRRYSHIVDPKTGLGLTDRIACSVVAPDSTTADAYATAFCVMGVAKTEAFGETNPELQMHVRMTWQSDQGGGFKTHLMNWGQWPAKDAPQQGD
ncbi:FAD:protein FMN transferase [Verrucomicrobium spinosum]|uniref:FAD:protein FMN transferase n=1 Tax=Verrucomicrobium spinosum TaxID=2736 RepID=UPI0012F6B985|nr:FAD:protein FMN transferase [Verrucomicrobium spinosum]